MVMITFITYTSGRDLILGNLNTRLILCFLLAFVITFILIPVIVKIAKSKALFDNPGDRSSHQIKTPTLGGLAIFNGVAISSLLFFDFKLSPNFQYIIAGLLIIFLSGIKDDLIGITPFKKFVSQLFAIVIIIVFGRIVLTNLHGFLGVHEIPYHVGVVITMITIVGITNCFNLMDGIDGLTASMGILVAAAFGVWFFLIGQYNWASISGALIGALMAFFLFNVFGKEHKIFMGDTGSLVLGYIVAIMAIKFNELNINLEGPYAMQAAPAVSIGVILVPFYDTLRVFFTRIFRNVSPFTADKTHIHHYLLELGLNHFQSTLVLFLAGVLFIVVSYLLRDLTVAWLLLILLAMASFLSYIPITWVEIKRQQQRKKSQASIPLSK